MAEAGIYKIECVATGMSYIGSSCDVRERWGQHVRMLKSGSHCCKSLQVDWTKYGETNFLFCVISHRATRADRELEENRIIKKLNESGKCYNSRIPSERALDNLQEKALNPIESKPFIPVLSVTEAARLFGMTRPNLCNMLAKGRGPMPVLVGNHRMFHEDAVREWKKHYDLNLKRRRRKGD